MAGPDASSLARAISAIPWELNYNCGVASRISGCCAIVRSSVSFMLITILGMINLAMHSPQLACSGSDLIGYAGRLQAHATLERTPT